MILIEDVWIGNAMVPFVGVTTVAMSRICVVLIRVIPMPYAFIQAAV